MDERLYVCPTCAAKPGERCSDPEGNGRDTHKDRSGARLLRAEV